MTNIVTIGMNHETAQVEIRECLARDPDNVSRALSVMRDHQAILEGLYISTCNRVEALYTTDNISEARNSILEVFSKLGGIRAEDLAPSLYTLEDTESVRHVFKVASSLDSMVVGEPQILGQIKEAYFQATRAKTSGVILNRLMHRAFHVAKRVRTETGISDAAVSISYAAVELAKKIFHQLAGRKVLLVGAGEMAELAARYLLSHGVEKISVANRTFERAVQVAGGFHGKPVYFEEIESELVEADIVITSTASPEYVITHEQVKRSFRKRRNRPLFFIDIAVPRDVEPRVNSLGNSYVYDIDDLRGVVEINRAQRLEEAVKAERIVEEEVLRFEAWLKTLGVVPTIVRLKEKVEEIRRTELRRSLSGLGDLTEHQRQALDLLTTSIAEKIIHDPILTLKQKADRPSRDQVLDLTRRLFRLDDNHD
ncbi:MAG: glutamyl-tRNA reductase [Thermodesulfobacteriota bacterium]